ncbi:phosphate propanoyltransferase [Anoxybacterium hadale]|uniref:Phosphate propanoyltransferase n=1 Tax=Anoxybacterium hadale TaxID=3408580 RepID=A0ACD1AC12_9FIRM|nr:phosphate propanoyltransferase [Clostridiales bacterium]
MIITESDLRANWSKEKITILRIPPGSVITPPAREFIRNKGIHVEIEGEGAIDFTSLTYSTAVHSKQDEKAHERKTPSAAFGDTMFDKTGHPVVYQSDRAGISAGHIKTDNAVKSDSKRKPNPEVTSEKPEYMTHLNGKKLVAKSHPVIRLRGQLDSFLSQLVETELWFLEKGCIGMAEKLGEVVVFCRGLMQAEVLEKEFDFPIIFGFNKEQLREISHDPMKYFGVKHSFVSKRHGMSVARLHILRTKSREVELAAVDAFVTSNGKCSREDIVSALNRLSSIMYILVCLEKARLKDGGVLSGEAARTRRFDVNIGVSNRHIHLSQNDLEVLFGAGYQLTKKKELSQPGQYAAKETLGLTGPKGKIDHVRILGPVRKESQVEISVSDSIKLGLEPPVRDSGDIDATPGITLAGPKGTLELKKGVIIAKRHLHLDPATAKEIGLKDRDVITAELRTERPILLEGIGVRVSDQYATDLHIDVDEANAALAKNGDKAVLILAASGIPGVPGVLEVRQGVLDG